MIEALCRIPLALKAEGRSVLELVQATGYLDSPTPLSSDALAAYLREHPELIDAWLGYSSDKRTSSGWYLKQPEQQVFEVGFFPNGERRSYTDGVRACADFIARELHEVGGQCRLTTG